MIEHMNANKQFVEVIIARASSPLRLSFCR